MRKIWFSGGGATAVVAAFLITSAAQAQWMSQRISLAPGWNAIHLKVHPADPACAAVFGVDGVEQVSWWNRDRIDDGTGSAVTDFCNWYRNSSGEPNTFSRVVGDQCYLVKSTRSTSFLVTGIPAVPKGTIYLGEYNLVGVNAPNVSSANAPTYYEYFESFGHPASWYSVTAGNEMLRLPNSARVEDSSKAVWLDAKGSGTAAYTGPFLISLGGANAPKTLEWTDDPTKVRTLTIKNVSSQDRALVIYRNSTSVPPTGHGTAAGGIALLVETVDWSAGYANRVYTPFLNNAKSTFTTNIAAGATLELNFRPDTSRMPAASGDYMSVLEVNDRGSVLDGETRTYGTCRYHVGAFASGSLAANATAAKAGLWVGTVVLGQVNRAKMLGSSTPEWNPEALMSAPHPFQFRLLLHVDANGTAKILKQVFSAKRTVDAETTDLLTDRDTAIAYRGLFPDATIRRTASANFPFIDPLALSGGAFMEPDSELTATFTQSYDDRTNPFVHSFHPQHDNVEFRNKTAYLKESGDEGIGDYESWGVTRQLKLKFAADDPSGAAGDAWNRTVTGGEYTERVSGLNGQLKPIIAKGVFRLSKVCDTAQLTTEVIH